MINNTNSLVREFFQKNNLGEVSNDELQEFIQSYPYSSIGSLLYAQKLKLDNDHRFSSAVADTALYFNNQRWLNNLLNDLGGLDLIANKNPIIQTETIEKQPEPETQAQTVDTKDVEVEKEEIAVPLSFEPYHTVDYFASQGIKLSSVEGSDKLGQKVKSFTEWLKTMKKIQAEQSKTQTLSSEAVTDNSMPVPENDQQGALVITESMAEVYVKQGLIEKAIEIYEKLSLQNPANSHIFADRIKALKDSKP